MNLNKNKLICTVTGKLVSVAPKVFDQRAAKYGSEELLRANYVSALGRRILCTGKPVSQIREELAVPATVPIPSEETIAKHTRWAKYRSPKISNENNTQASETRDS